VEDDVVYGERQMTLVWTLNQPTAPGFPLQVERRVEDGSGGHPSLLRRLHCFGLQLNGKGGRHVLPQLPIALPKRGAQGRMTPDQDLQALPQTIEVERTL